MRYLACLLGLVLLGLCDHPAFAQDLDDAQWVWFGEGNPLEQAPAETIWFRRVVRATGPSTGAIRIACDDHFVLWVNGQKIGEGGAKQPHRFNLNGIVERGLNVIAIEAQNKDGKAGLFVDGEVRDQGGKKFPFDTPTEWKATKVAPQGTAWLAPKFDDSNWQPAKALVAHKDSPWKELEFVGTYLDRFELAAGFELKRIGEPELVGSIVAITWGNDGRLLASRERGPILSLGDTNGDGTYDDVKEFTAKVKNCQGLCQVKDDLFVVGDGPQGTGVYRLPDANHDHQADDVIFIQKSKGGMGEHGPHDIVWGPDGWLYHNAGNHAGVDTTPEANSPCRNQIEGYLLEPKFEDAGGHAVGVKAPGGTIWRFTPDGKKWWMETNGFRNHYDIAFNSQGDLFTFDSDMEWDVNLPWYRPVRINHCTPGAEFGWRSGSAKWPAEYVDSLPGTVNVGRGSPTGVVFYEHTHFPEKYRGAMLNCDWSMGRLIVSYLKKDGASYTGTFDNLVTGNPLNISDVEVDRDGTVVFSTGGRGTEGGIYRVTYSGTAPKAVATPASVEEILALPQGQSAWARDLNLQAKTKLGDQWASGMTAVLQSGAPAQKVRALSLLTMFGPAPSVEALATVSQDKDASVRAFATWLLGSHSGDAVAKALAQRLDDSDGTVRRRAAEALVRANLEIPVAGALKLLESTDRWERWAGRIALERVPVQKWKADVLGHSNADVILNGLLALQRLGTEAVTADEAWAAAGKLIRQPSFHEGDGQRKSGDLIRVGELLILTHGNPPAELVQMTANALEEDLGKDQINSESRQERANVMELARLAARLQAPKSAGLLITAIKQCKNPFEQIHYALCLRYVKEGWTAEHKKDLLAWFDSTSDLEGGNSLQGYIRNIVGASLEYYTPEDRAAALLGWKDHPHAAQLVLNQSSPAQIKDYDHVLSQLLEGVEQNPALVNLVLSAIDSLGKSNEKSAQDTLRKLSDQHPDQRDLIARSLALHPSPENVPYYLRSLATGDSATMQQCLQALRKSGYQPEQAEPYRLVILAGLKLENGGGALAVDLLSHWTKTPPVKERGVAARVAGYQKWYHEKFPGAPNAELAKDDLEKSKHTLAQLEALLEKNPEASPDAITRGKSVFTKATCVKCHRFLKDGEGVGPDLTSLRRRFQKKEILESILYPSQVMSDQFRSVTITTTEGLVYNGMPLPQQGNTNTVILLLPDATKVVVPKDKIEEQVASKVSVMPVGLLNNLTEQEIVDLFAFLETSRNNPEPVAAK